jgi:hypothetical protein
MYELKDLKVITFDGNNYLGKMQLADIQANETINKVVDAIPMGGSSPKKEWLKAEFRKTLKDYTLSALLPYSERSLDEDELLDFQELQAKFELAKKRAPQDMVCSYFDNKN